MIRLLGLLVMIAASARAETARVYSGEHADFTRLVVELPAAGDWTVGRTPMGYAFASGDGKQPVFEIAGVWDRIAKTRLQALRTDPESGALQLTLACACHVFPFEYQPGIVVLDIKPGPAPAGSTFESAFAPDTVAASGVPPSLASVPAYDWLESSRSAAAPAFATAEIDLPAGEVSLDPLRRELLEQISRGAAQGVVDMALPDKSPDHEPAEHGTLPWSQIHIGPPTDAQIAANGEGTADMAPDGQACVPDDELALAEWGADRRPLDLLSEARSGLYGEFDALDPEAALRAVRLHLHLGFGAEAAQYASLLSGPEAPATLEILRSLAMLVEGEPDPKSPLLDMLACKGAAALWAALAHESLPSGVAVNADAIVRNFLALPPHLRAALGAGLAEKLVVHGDSEAARIVRNAVERTPDVSRATVALLDAKTELHGGEPAAALDHAAIAVAEDGSGSEEWIALVEAHFRKIEPMTPDSVEALRAFQGELESSGQRQDFFRALALAELLSGQTEAGFRTAEAQGLPLTDLWLVAAGLAEDDAFLLRALSGQSADVAPEVATRVGQRLVELGFPDAGLAWLGPIEPGDSAERRRIAAKAELARGDARRTLALLDGLTGPEDHELRGRAMMQLGQIAGARTALAAAGLPDEALRLATWEGAWADLVAVEAPYWASAVTDTGLELPTDAGPLARGAAILDASAASRNAIQALLAGVAGPGP